MNGEMTIDGVKLKWYLSLNVSHNYANPHRLMAYCGCGRSFLQLAAGRNVNRNIEKYVANGYRRHVRDGFCRFQDNSERTKVKQGGI